jgi:hypothetical protein
MLFASVFFVSACLAFGSGSPEAKVVQDLYTSNFVVKRSEPPVTPYSIDIFVKHINSGRYIRPDGGLCAWNHSPVRIGNTHYDRDYEFRFMQEIGSFGYIEHPHCNRVVHTHFAWLHPPDNSDIYVHTDLQGAAVTWCYDDNYEYIIHRGGQLLQPMYQSVNPSEGHPMSVHTQGGPAAKMMFVPLNGDSFYPEPTLTGKWVKLFEIENADSEVIYTVNHIVGKTMSIKATDAVCYTASKDRSIKWFGESSELGGFANLTQTVTWEEETANSHTLTVLKGETTVLWQWVFFATRLQEQYQFRSTILAVTHDVNMTPTFEDIIVAG